MKKNYKELLMKIVVIKEDVLTESLGLDVELDENELPFVPFFN